VPNAMIGSVPPKCDVISGFVQLSLGEVCAYTVQQLSGSGELLERRTGTCSAPRVLHPVAHEVRMVVRRVSGTQPGSAYTVRITNMHARNRSVFPAHCKS
jgi:hypothetical protein